MDDNNPEECPVCWTLFDEVEAEERPRNLPCGHTFCTFCINKLKKKSSVSCPSCRTKHKVPSTGHFAINYTLESVIKSHRDTSGKKRPASAQLKLWSEKKRRCLSRKMCALLRDQEGRVQDSIKACQEAQLQLDSYQTNLESLQTQHQCLEEILQAALDVVRTARGALQQEGCQMQDRKQQAQKEEKELHELLGPLSRVTTVEEACKMISKTHQTSRKVEQGVDKWMKTFPGPDTVAATRKVRDASNQALQALNTILASLQPNSQGSADDQCCHITSKLNAMLTTTLTAESVFSLQQPARCLLEGGVVVAVMQGQKDERHARISLENNQLYLHSLQNLPPPFGAATIPLEEIVPVKPPCTVFLDIAWPGTAPQRVIIYLSPDTPRGRQFLNLCLGQWGVSYANTSLLGVGNKGQPGEWIWGGDYSHNDGQGGAAFLRDLDWGAYRRSSHAGDVWGEYGGDASRGAQFGINVSNWNDGHMFYGAFGEVVSGLGVLREAAQQNDVRQVTVVDCGVVLAECWGPSSPPPTPPALT